MSFRVEPPANMDEWRNNWKQREDLFVESYEYLKKIGVDMYKWTDELEKATPEDVRRVIGKVLAESRRCDGRHLPNRAR